MGRCYHVAYGSTPASLDPLTAKHGQLPRRTRQKREHGVRPSTRVRQGQCVLPNCLHSVSRSRGLWWVKRWVFANPRDSSLGPVGRGSNHHRACRYRMLCIPLSADRTRVGFCDLSAGRDQAGDHRSSYRRVHVVCVRREYPFIRSLVFSGYCSLDMWCGVVGSDRLSAATDDSLNASEAACDHQVTRRGDVG